jgi:hypothetical protein
MEGDAGESADQRRTDGMPRARFAHPGKRRSRRRGPSRFWASGHGYSDFLSVNRRSSARAASLWELLATSIIIRLASGSVSCSACTRSQRPHRRRVITHRDRACRSFHAPRVDGSGHLANYMHVRKTIGAAQQEFSYARPPPDQGDFVFDLC